LRHSIVLREAEPAAAESAIIDYGNALRDLAASNVFRRSAAEEFRRYQPRPRHFLRLR